MKRTIALLASAAVAAATPAVALAATAGEAAAPTQTIAQIAAGNPNFSTLVSLLKKVGLVKVLNGTTDYTVFAPTNAAFAAVPAATLKALAADKTELKAVLLYHVIPGSLPASEVVKHKTLTTAEGAALTITVKGMDVYVNKAQVTQANIHATNGYIHVINAVLIPPSK
ncbi:MAG: fasciclin domain-containing protein [Solirubrobacteraceae bacterium]